MTPSVIIRIVTAFLALTVAMIALPRRSQVGARSLAALMLVTAWWAAGTVFECTAIGIPAKVSWAKIEYLGVTSAPVCFLLFALEYARTERWLSRRNLIPLFIVPLISVVLAVTNEWHHLIWTSFTPVDAGQTRIVYGRGVWFWIGVAGYSYAMLLSGSVLLIRAALYYPNVYRSQIITVILGASVPWIGNLLYVVGLNPLPGIDPTPTLIAAMGAIFAWAILRRHWLDLIPVARHNVIENMNDAMIVFDAQARLVDLNPAAQEVLGVSIADTVGRPAAELLRQYPAILDALSHAAPDQVEITLQVHETPHYYSVRISPLHDARRNLTGHVLVLHDITALVHAQDAVQQAALLEERERMARELHDNLGQVLSYLSLNTQAIRDLIERGNYPAALGQLDALGLAAQSANRDVREFILGNSMPASEAQGFTAVLQLNLARLEAITGLRVQLSLPADSIDATLPSSAYVHLLRIIQEALANTRKHAHATHADVVFTLTPEQFQMVVSDDGVGFAVNVASAGVGLSVMRERAAQIGAGCEIRSALGQGTQVILKFARAEPDAMAAQLAGVTVVLVDDHPLFAEGMRDWLVERGLAVVGVASNGDQAIRLAAELKPDILLLDVHMPGRSGSQVVKPIKDASPNTQILMLSVSAEDEALTESLSQGASGYLLKSQPPEELFKALVAVRHGDTPLAPGLANQLAMHVTAPGVPHGEHARQILLSAGLSLQQIDILACVAQGQMYKEIAASLHISESAIKYHVERIQALLDVANRAEAVAFAFKIGLAQDRRSNKL